MPNPEKKKLLAITSTFPRWTDDATPAFVFDLCKRLQQDFDVLVLAPHYPNSKTFEVMEGIKVFRFRYFFQAFEKLAGSGGIVSTLKNNKLYFLLVPFFLMAELLALRKLIKRERPDLIHAHWIIPQGLLAVFLKKFYKVPVAVTSHGGDIFGLKGKLATTLKKYTLNRADRIIAVSQRIQTEIQKITRNDKICQLSMGVDSQVFNPSKKDITLKTKYEIHGPFLLFVGRLTAVKGVEYLIHAVSKVTPLFPKAKLLIIGSGSKERELKQLTKQLQLQDTIVFTGALSNTQLPAYYATADFFIAPSIRDPSEGEEGFGLVLIEAGMSGCALIGASVGAIPEIIIPGKTGYLVSPQNVDQLAELLIKVLSDSDSTSLLKNQTVKLFVEHYDWRTIAKKHVEMLSQML